MSEYGGSYDATEMERLLGKGFSRLYESDAGVAALLERSGL